VGQSIILAGVAMMLFSVALKRQQWGLLWAAAMIVGLYASYVLLFGMQYRIFWDDAGIRMRASGGPARSIRFEEFTEIRYETATPEEFLAQARPFRRIVILENRRDPNDSTDASLSHFRTEDIETLLTAIHRSRPDLTVPRIQSINKR
jgi:hypothetical protein